MPSALAAAFECPRLTHCLCGVLASLQPTVGLAGETPLTRGQFGVRLLDSRDLLPAYSHSIPDDAHASSLAHGTQIVALTSDSFLLMASKGVQGWIGRISVRGCATVVKASLNSAMLKRRGAQAQPLLDFTTRGVRCGATIPKMNTHGARACFFPLARC